MTALFDPSVWESLRRETAATDPRMLEDLIHDLRAQVPDLFIRMQAAVVAEDFVALREVAHRLKGGAGMLGFPRLAHAAMEVETAAKMGEVLNIQAQVNYLRSASHETFSDPAVMAIS